VVKSRSAPSLLGGYSSSRQPQDHLPSNRFIELGDIALGNSRRHGSWGEVDVPTLATSEPELEPEIQSRPKTQRRPKPTKKSKAVQLSSETQRTEITSRPKVMTAPLTRPKPPRAPVSLPRMQLPPKMALPKPPKIYRPKPQAVLPKRRDRPK
jgi:hypothetical protein